MSIIEKMGAIEKGPLDAVSIGFGQAMLGDVDHGAK
jgi:hypothetical protein